MSILQDAGLSLPPNRTIQNLSDDQAASTLHNEVDVALDLHPGAPTEIPDREIQNWPAPAALKLVKVQRDVPGKVGRLPLEVPNSFFSFGLTASNEVLSISRCNDYRWRYHEQNGRYLRTKLDLSFWFLNDPGITKVSVYETTVVDDKWSLRKIGDVQILHAGF
jgi:hypothetical protein